MYVYYIKIRFYIPIRRKKVFYDVKQFMTKFANNNMTVSLCFKLLYHNIIKNIN